MIAGTPDILLLDPWCSGYAAVWDDSLMLPGRCRADTDDLRTFTLRGAARIGRDILIGVDLSSFTDVDPDMDATQQSGFWTRSDELRLQGFYRLTGHVWYGIGAACYGPFGGHSIQAVWHGFVGYENVTPPYEPAERGWGPVVSVQAEDADWFGSASLTPWSAAAAAGRHWRPAPRWALGARVEAHYVVDDAPWAQRFSEKEETGLWASASYIRESLFLSAGFNPVHIRAEMQIGWRF